MHPDEFRHVGIIERKSTRHHDEQNDPQTPYVDQHGVIRDATHHFRCCVGCRTAVGLAEDPLLRDWVHHLAGESEILNFRFRTESHDYVVTLEVPVGDLHGVEELDGAQKSVEYVSGGGKLTLSISIQIQFQMTHFNEMVLDMR